MEEYSQPDNSEVKLLESEIEMLKRQSEILADALESRQTDYDIKSRETISEILAVKNDMLLSQVKILKDDRTRLKAKIKDLERIVNAK